MSMTSAPRHKRQKNGFENPAEKSPRFGFVNEV